MTTAAADNLYTWADEVITQLTGRGHPNPKLSLAQSLDITTDARWKGSAATERNTPRHRVIARFAREGLWEQIWSLNWDCVQESALENVGIKRGAQDSGMPWPVGFHTFITAAECASMAAANSVRMVKPHGCAMALVQAEEMERRGDHIQAAAFASRFLITKSELDGLAPTDGTQKFVFHAFCEKLSSNPIVIAGWSVSERYLLEYIERHVRQQLDARAPLPLDELSIIDPNFNPRHAQLATCYGKNQASAHVPINPPAFTADELFLWIQALYAVQCLRVYASVADQAVMDQITAQVVQPPDVLPFVNSWADSFLPVWVRLCWRCGLVICRNERTGMPIRPEEIDLESRDEHVPWRVLQIDRPDLRTASVLLGHLQRSGRGGGWDFEKFPGGLYRENKLVIPLPAWDTAEWNDIRGLKALIEAIKAPGAGYIERLAVLPIPERPGDTILPAVTITLRELLSRSLAMARFAKGDDIEVFDVTEF